jgi:quinol monooxygenase YgiN
MSASPVSIHPYFKVQPGQMPAAEALLPRFIARTASEPGVLWYEFTRTGDTVFCREGYRDGESALAHLANVEALLKEMLGLSTLERLEFHGPAAELAKLKEPLKDLPVVWFELQDRLER